MKTIFHFIALLLIWSVGSKYLLLLSVILTFLHFRRKLYVKHQIVPKPDHELSFCDPIVDCVPDPGGV